MLVMLTKIAILHWALAKGATCVDVPSATPGLLEDDACPTAAEIVAAHVRRWHETSK